MFCCGCSKLNDGSRVVVARRKYSMGSKASKRLLQSLCRLGFSKEFRRTEQL